MKMKKIFLSAVLIAALSMPGAAMAAQPASELTQFAEISGNEAAAVSDNETPAVSDNEATDVSGNEAPTVSDNETPGEVTPNEPDQPIKQGMVEENGAWYYYKKGVRVTDRLICLRDEDGAPHYYYLQSNGKAYTKGIKKLEVNGETRYYFFQSNGEALTSEFRAVRVKDSTYYYYFRANGRALVSTWKIIEGKKYYFGANGRAYAAYRGWNQMDGAWNYFNSKGQLNYRWIQKNGVWTYENTITGTVRYESDLLYKTWQKAQKMDSSTQYLILVDLTNCKTMVFKGSKGSWCPYRMFKCSPGKPSTPTVRGDFTVTGRGYSFGTSSYTCYYYTQFYGNYLFHSVLYHAGTFRVKDGRLGMHLSHGCVRMHINSAKWIYDNIPNKTHVNIYY